ncbi:hypothetical protein BRDID11002_57690 [Bradyrhizobium diazoefficiens]
MRLPFFYGWVVVAVTFVTMAIGVNARTAFSLFFPPIISEFGWERGVTAGAFSFGFVVSGVVSPLIGRLMDRAGPRAVMELGVALMGGGLLLAPLTSEPWHLYVTIGVMVGAGSVCLGYSGQSLFLPNWFIRKRGFAIGIAFAGVGIGSVTLLPWVQHMIEETGWRTACTAMGLLILIVLAPINLFLRKRPEDIGLRPDGDAAPVAGAAKPVSNIVDPVWVGTEWTLKRAVGTARFWWIAVGYFSGLYIWYAVQVHQTKFLLDIGFQPRCRGVGARHRQPARHSRPDRAGPCFRSHWTGMGLGHQLRGLCDLFRGTDGAEVPAFALARLSHGVRARRARLRPHLDHGRGGVRDLPGQAPGQHLRYDHAGGPGWRRGRSLAHGFSP